MSNPELEMVATLRAEQAMAEFKKLEETAYRFNGMLAEAGVDIKDFNTGLRVTSQGLSGMRSVLTTVSISTFVMVLGIRQLTHSMERITDAQESYNAKVAKYGALSKEAQSALRNVGLAQQDAALAAFQFVVQILVMIMNIPILNAQLKILQSELAAANLAMGPVGWAALGIGALGAAVLGITLYNTSINATVTAGVTEGSLNSALDKLNKEIKRKAEYAGVPPG